MAYSIQPIFNSKNKDVMRERERERERQRERERERERERGGVKLIRVITGSLFCIRCN